MTASLLSKTVQKTKFIDLLENYIKAAITYERNIVFLSKNGNAVDTDDENSIHDFLNEYGGLFDDEYEQLKDIFIEYWKENDIVIAFDFCSSDYQCPIKFAKANYSDLHSMTREIRKLISYLADCQTQYNDAEEAVELTGDEASDRFSDLLYSYGLDYFLYLELYEMEWVEADF